MMKTPRVLVAITAVILLAACEKTPPPKPLPSPPEITQFAAEKTRIEPGESVKLSFTAQNASEAQIVDQLGTKLTLSGTAEKGEVTVTPSETSFYVLTVSGEGGRATAYVQVAVGEPLKSVFLVAVPPEVESGGSAQLLWSAFGASSVKLLTTAGEEIALDDADRTGIHEVTPARSETYSLVASSAGSVEEASATAEVKVHAVLAGFQVAPAAAKPGETLTLSWKARGADEVVITEATFGELHRVSLATDAAAVDEGNLVWTVPETLPSGATLQEGYRLSFKITVHQTNPDQTLDQTINSFVGEGPKVDAFFVPAAVTEGHPVPLKWTTLNAVQVAVRVNGLPVFETLASDPSRAASGTFTLPTIAQDLSIELVAKSFDGATATETRQVKMVSPPQIDTFELPTGVNSSGDRAQAKWTTKDATFVSIRPLDGPVVYSTVDMAKVASGEADLYPGDTTTYVLEAWNAAGQKATKNAQVQVFTPASVTVTPSSAVPGTNVDITWQLDVNTTTDVIGLPNSQAIPYTTAGSWLDLHGHVDAQKLVITSGDDEVVRLPLGIPFRFPFIDGIREDFYVSTNGFVAFSDVGALPTNEDLSTSAAPELLAPFWDDLQVGVGEILYLVEGTQFPRRLVVQWQDVSTADETSRLSFQIQLFESGEVRYVYKTLQGVDATGANATIGMKLDGGAFHAQLAYNLGSGVLNEDSEYSWLTGSPLSGTVTLPTQRTSHYGFLARLQGGHYMTLGAPVWIFGPESLQVSEVMAVAGAGATKGTWIELYNAQDVAVNVEGIELTTSSSTQPYVLPSIIVPAKGYLVLGETTDAAENGDAKVTEVWSGITLSSADTVQLQLLGTTLSSLEWSAANAGESVQLTQSAIDGTGGPISCTRTTTFGSGYIGTPGAANESCYDYTVKAIPGGFEDISTTGTEILANESDYDGIGTFQLPVTFPYFGQPQSSVSVSMVGFVSFGSPLTSAYDTTNDTTPGSASPNGTVAPFWDQLVRNTNGRLMMERKATYTIVSWQDFRIFATTSSMNFQVKLFDDGVIEFHYGTFTASTSSATDRTTGSSATTWIEALDGSSALPVNINTVGGITANSGWRFTPKQ